MKCHKCSLEICCCWVRSYSESDLERWLVAYVDYVGGTTKKLVELGNVGFPDRTILIGGKIGFLELKNGDRPNRPDPIQKIQIKQLREYGFQADVANTPRLCVKFIDRMLSW